MEQIEITYDKHGRMNYHPDFHKNHKKPWTSSEIEYLINWYSFIGPEEMSFALERTIKSVGQMVASLRKMGLIKENTIYGKRIKPNIKEELL